MINEREEFVAYTGLLEYRATSKQDSTYMGRFTFDTILEGEGLTRILTILARGYLWNPDCNLEHCRRALCAWCSIPDKKSASPKEDWQYRSDFREYHKEFPELVDATGGGWFYRHVHGIEKFIKKNPDKVSVSAKKNAPILHSKWNTWWRDKVMQFQHPIFMEETRGGWIIRFDDILADALELGPLRDMDSEIPVAAAQKINAICPKKVPAEVLMTLYAYYEANKPEDSPWVILPVSNFSAYFGTTSFSRKWLSKIPAEFMERQKQSYGVCRYRICHHFTKI